MKKVIALLIMTLFGNYVFAGDLFQTTNPFPQTMPETMNNIYESTPAVMQKEILKEKNYKTNKQKKNINSKNKDINQNNEINEGILPVYPKIKDSLNNDGSYYRFQ